MNQVYLNNIDPAAIEDLYQKYLTDQTSVDIHWQKFFEGFEFASDLSSPDAQNRLVNSEVLDHIKKETAVLNLINEYRARGHLFSKTNPIRKRRIYSPPITIDRFGLSDKDLNTVFQAGQAIGLADSTLQAIIDHLDVTYCRSIGCEYTMIRSPNTLNWMKERLEKNRNTPSFSKKQKLKILETLGKAVLFEQFMHTRFVGQKRFSLEGLEALIPALQTVIEYGSHIGIKEFIVGMSHRGRLNVLANTFQKDYEQIFSEFDAKGYQEKTFGGDVKYHMGYSSDVVIDENKKVHLSMLPNPSHLEAVNPVTAGTNRAKLDHRHQSNANQIVSILIHGDASIAGQGVIYEQIQMSQLPAYSVGGTVHIVINNQIGFTTNYLETRTSTYCTDIAKVGLCPVFHVNADDIEAVVHAVLLALEFRQTFHRDVFIDILGYRKYGHNEGDDPHFTQPILYDLIKNHENSLEIYSKKLIAQGIVDEKYTEELKTNFLELLDEKLANAKKMQNTPLSSFLKGDWKKIRLPVSGELCQAPLSGVAIKDLSQIIDCLTTLPEDKPFMKKIHVLLAAKHKAFYETDRIDWSTAEALAFGSLLQKGYHVRLTGQDVVRGTFSQRHAMLRTEDEALDYYPLKNLTDDQGRFMIFNSTLSEYAILGFEYGYALAQPDTLTLWEAQFGDFANGAQIIVDQFIAAAETKWQRMNGIVLLLPHGQEGQGPEHSSGRIERFLQLCAHDNMFIVTPSTPANYFHVLRRQLLQPFRKPLILFTPKSLLRHPLCVSSKKDFDVNTSFKDIIDDDVADKGAIKKLLLCSGKIYYELLHYRLKHKVKNVALVRVEQLYPFDSNLLNTIVASYPNLETIKWVQEEPARQGAMLFIDWFWKEKKLPLNIVSRAESSTTATGFINIHKKEQAELLKQAFS